MRRDSGKLEEQEHLTKKVNRAFDQKERNRSGFSQPRLTDEHQELALRLAQGVFLPKLAVKFPNYCAYEVH